MVPADDTWKISTSRTAIESGYKKLSSLLSSYIGRPAGRLVPRDLSLSDSSWKRPPGRKRKFFMEVVKQDLRTLGGDRQFRRDVRFRRILSSDEWIDSVQAFAEDRKGWAELCSRIHLGEDAGNRVRTSARRLSKVKSSPEDFAIEKRTLSFLPKREMSGLGSGFSTEWPQWISLYNKDELERFRNRCDSLKQK
ncbi:hypothetical protein RB195_015091 [Necator americanus]|uniref:Uncharacterized protein n=1 Tax=Necator americanus TaxID=51031 RepID=A0ABR1E2X9_NECAM